MCPTYGYSEKFWESVATPMATIYRTMHYSAKRSLAITCYLSVCLSVRPSVTLVDQDHIGWKSWILIAQNSFALLAQRTSTYSEGNMGKFGGDWRWSGKKWHSGAQKRQYLLNAYAVKIEKKLLWRPIETHLRSFERYHPRPPTA